VIGVESKDPGFADNSMKTGHDVIVRREQEITCNFAGWIFRLQINSLEGKGGPRLLTKATLQPKRTPVYCCAPRG
jgi:hypothetical protein